MFFSKITQIMIEELLKRNDSSRVLDHDVILLQITIRPCARLHTKQESIRLFSDIWHVHYHSHSLPTPH